MTERTQFAIRDCQDDDVLNMVPIINDAAKAYQGVIPDDCWREPYMTKSDLKSGIAVGVRFVGCQVDGVLSAVMGIQSVRNVKLIRHA